MSIFNRNKREMTLPDGFTFTPNCRAYLVSIEMQIAEEILKNTESIIKKPNEEIVGRLQGLHTALGIVRREQDNVEELVKLG